MADWAWMLSCIDIDWWWWFGRIREWYNTSGVRQVTIKMMKNECSTFLIFVVSGDIFWVACPRFHC